MSQPARLFTAGLLIGVVLGLGGCGRAENSLLLLEDLPDLESITFEGNESFDAGTLRELMTLRTGSWWNPFRDHRFRRGQLDSDLLAILTYYMRRGYLQVRVLDTQIRHDGNKVHLTINLEEGEPFRVAGLRIMGTQALDPESLVKKLKLRTGSPLDPFQLEDDRRRVLRTLQEGGFWNGTVEADVQFFGQNGLVFHVVRENAPIRARAVDVTGLKEIKSSVAAREIKVKRGKVLRLDDLRQSQLQLLQSGYFSDAQWDTAGLDPMAGSVTVRFRLRERQQRRIEGGVGLTGQEQLRFTSDWGSRNFLRTGNRIGLTTRTDLDLTDRVPTLLDEHRTDATVSLPHFAGSPIEVRPGLSYRHDRGVLDLGSGRADYLQNTLGAGVSGRWAFGDLRNQVVLSLENRWVYNDADSAARASDPQLFRDDYQTRLITLRLERDSRNDFFEPSQGRYQSAILESAGGALGGNNAFRKGTVGMTAFRRLPLAGGVIAVRGQAGLIRPSSEATSISGQPIASRVELIPSEDRYLLGGGNTVRGFDVDQLNGTSAVAGDTSGAEGGLVQLLLNVEVRIPLVWRLSGVAFLDAGNVWQDGRFLTLDRFVPHLNREEVDPRDMRYSYGAGMRFRTPLGPIRVDYARKWNRPAGVVEGKDRWHVAIGHAF